MESIYTRFSRRETSFENTLALLQELLNERLLPEYRRIWVQASNSGRVRFCFTIFPNSGQYTMRFFDVGSLRQFRSDGILDDEIELIERLISNLSEGVLKEYII
jgi:hypothetical protein